MTATTPPTPSAPEPEQEIQRFGRDETTRPATDIATHEADAPLLAPAEQGPPVGAAFRLAGTHRPQPLDSRVLVVFAWVTALGVVGLAVALCGLAGISAGADPSWYQPTLAALGLGGVGLMVAGMVTGQRRHVRLPWILLGLATVPVAVNLLLTLTAL